MPQNNYIFDQGRGGLSPIIIPPSAGDREEARVNRLTQLAKLRNLELEPQQQQRLYELNRAQLEEQKRQNQSQTNTQIRGQDIDMRGKTFSNVVKT